MSRILRAAALVVFSLLVTCMPKASFAETFHLQVPACRLADSRTLATPYASTRSVAVKDPRVIAAQGGACR